MARRFAGETLIIASHNPGKLHEIRDLVAPFGIRVSAASDLGLPEPEETGESFAANAGLKARAAACAVCAPALADDSGLVVPALGGRPGIHSARWAEPGGSSQQRDFAAAMRRVEAELGDNPDRSACFVAVLALAWPDAHCETFEGRIDGRLVFPPRGTQGFGYDPIFLPDGYEETFGEMAPANKHRISHRARAFARLIAACFTATECEE